MPTPPHNPVSKLNSARSAARRTRAEWLLAINAGVLGLPELVEAASASPTSPLRAIPLAEVLRHTPGWSPASTEAAMASLRHLAGVRRATPERELNVGWLVDGRANARRIDALTDVIGANDRTAPSARFPWTPV